MENLHPADETQERILTEAEILFAQKGFRGVTVREVTEAAHANLASVNYYFGSKQNLYLEVFKKRWLPRARQLNQAFDKNVAGAGSDPPGIPEVVEALARAVLEEGVMSEDERFRHHQLMSRELAEPSDAFDLVIKEAIRPMIEKMTRYFGRASLGRRTDREIALCIFSVMGMVLYFNFARPLISTVTGEPYDKGFMARVVSHIVDFSLYGLLGRKEDAPCSAP
ncbi:MAG: CerR family C-terminal domain-containing protein [Thermodesulfobacteriota bacterium]